MAMSQIQKRISEDAAKEVEDKFAGILCQACRHLLPSQLRVMTSAKFDAPNALVWYAQHLFYDHYASGDNKERAEVVKELDRIGYTIDEGDTNFTLSTWQFNLVKPPIDDTEALPHHS